jgi:hypothetical protein
LEEGCYSNSRARNAARSEICFSFIEIDTKQAVTTFGEGGRSGEPFGRALSAPVEALLRARLQMGELARG